MLSVISSAFNSASSYTAGHLVKKDKYDPFQVNLTRFLGLLVFSSIHVLILECRKYPAVSRFCKESFKENRLVLLFVLLRCGFGVTAMLFQFLAFSYITPADVSVVTYSNSILIILVARVVLKEPLTFYRIFASLLSIVGVFITARPPSVFGDMSPKHKNNTNSTMGDDMGDHKNHLMGLSLAIGSAVASTGAIISLRLVRGVHFAVVTTCFGALGATMCTILLGAFNIFSRHETPRLGPWLRLSSVAITSWLSINVLTLAFRYEKAGPIGVIRSLEIAMLFLWQLGDSYPEVTSVIGGSIVILSCVLVGFQNYVATTPENSKIRRSLWMVLK